MRFKIFTMAALCALAASASINAKQRTAELQALDDALPGNLINDPSRLDLAVYGAGVTSKPVKDASIPGGGGALQIVIPKAGATHYESGGNVGLTSEIKQGQKIVVAFYARTITAATASGKGQINVRVQQNTAPYTGFADTAFEVGPDWQLFEAKGVANISAAIGAANVGFMLSGAKQTVQIGQIIVVEGADSLRTITKTVSSAQKTSTFAPNFEGKGQLINNPTAPESWSFYGTALTNKPLAEKAMPDGKATAINIASVPANAYDAGVNIPINEALVEGDVLTIAFAARTISAETDTGAGKLSIRVQQNKAPYSGFGDNQLAIGPNWKLYQLRTQARLDIAKGEGVVALHLGGAQQSLELGPVYVLNAGPPAPNP
jgi:hypothetical protein